MRVTPLNGETEMRLRMRNIRDTFPVSAFWPRHFGRAWGCEAERTFSVTHSGVGCGSLYAWNYLLIFAHSWSFLLDIGCRALEFAKLRL